MMLLTHLVAANKNKFIDSPVATSAFGGRLLYTNSNDDDADEQSFDSALERADGSAWEEQSPNRVVVKKTKKIRTHSLRSLGKK